MNGCGSGTMWRRTQVTRFFHQEVKKLCYNWFYYVYQAVNQVFQNLSIKEKKKMVSFFCLTNQKILIFSIRLFIVRKLMMLCKGKSLLCWWHGDVNAKWRGWIWSQCCHCVVERQNSRFVLCRLRCHWPIAEGFSTLLSHSNRIQQRNTNTSNNKSFFLILSLCFPPRPVEGHADRAVSGFWGVRPFCCQSPQRGDLLSEGVTGKRPGKGRRGGG